MTTLKFKPTPNYIVSKLVRILLNTFDFKVQLMTLEDSNIILMTFKIFGIEGGIVNKLSKEQLTKIIGGLKNYGS